LSSEEVRELPQSVTSLGAAAGGAWEFRCDPWDWLTETKRVGLARILSDLRCQVEARMAVVGADLLSRGAELAPRRAEMQHFEWLARWQVGGELKNRIARDVGEGRATVQKGIRRAAELLVGPRYHQWLRASARPGRPKD
jgi:hypothetical protein